MHNPVERLQRVGCYLLDLDGTFYLGNRLLPGALEFIALLERRGIPYLFLTNNSSRARWEYAEKLHRLGLDIPDNRIFTSGEATARFLQKKHKNARLYVVGTPALETEFLEHGFTLDSERPDYAVLGFDTTLTYDKLRIFCDLLMSGIPYIATHPDINCPTETGFMPDIGAMIELIAASTKRRPDWIIGKPNPPIAQAIAEKTGMPIERLCMVGDRLYTDIALGQAGLLTVLVLSGETTRADLAGSPFQPDLIMENLAELALVLQGYMNDPYLHTTDA